ncbi:MAG: hypothetical protein ACXAD7_18635, partial [Candidatus Kariarchaeaceae archaeon]
ILIVIILVFSSIIISTITYNTSKENAKKALENANFYIKKFDIIGAENNEILVNASLEILNFTSSKIPSIITPLEIKIEMYNKSQYLGSTDFSVSNKKIANNQSILARIPVGNGQDGSFGGIFSKIMKTEIFQLKFVGYLKYKIGLIHDTVKFENLIFFDLDQEAVDFDMMKLDFPSKYQKIGKAEFAIFNPFTATLALKGIGEILVEDYEFGQIEIVDFIQLEQGWTNISHIVDLVDLPFDGMSEIFYRYVDSLVLQTLLEIKIDGISISVDTNFDLGESGSLYDVQVDKITDYSIDWGDNNLELIFDLVLISHLPFNLNITNINMTANTLAGARIGVINWGSTNAVPIPPYESITIYNVSSVFTDIGLTIFQVGLDQAIKITNGVVVILFFGEKLYYNFELDRVDF